MAKSEEVVVEESSSSTKFLVSMGPGYLTGESTELFFWPNQGNHKVSEPTWKIDNLFMIGFGAQLDLTDWFTTNIDGWFKATDGDGTMDDYDWLVPGADWTDWLRSDDTDVTDGSIVDINAELSFYQSAGWKINAIIGYSLQYNF